MAKPIEACHVAVGARIRMLRETLGLTQEDVAKRTALLRATCANGPANVLRALERTGYVVRKRDD